MKVHYKDILLRDYLIYFFFLAQVFLLCGAMLLRYNGGAAAAV